MNRFPSVLSGLCVACVVCLPTLTGASEVEQPSGETAAIAQKEWHEWVQGEWARLRGVRASFPPRLLLYEWTVTNREYQKGKDLPDPRLLNKFPDHPDATLAAMRARMLDPNAHNAFRLVVTEKGKRYSTEYTLPSGTGKGLQDMGVDGDKVWTWSESQVEVQSKSLGLEKHRDYDKGIDAIANENILKAYMFGLYRVITAEAPQFSESAATPDSCEFSGSFRADDAEWRATLTAVRQGEKRYFSAVHLSLGKKDGSFGPVGSTRYLEPTLDPMGTPYARVIESIKPDLGLVETMTIVNVRQIDATQGESLVAVPGFGRKDDLFRSFAPNTRVFDTSSGPIVETSRDADRLGRIDPETPPTEKLREATARESTQVSRTYTRAGYLVISAVVIVASAIFLRRRLAR